MYPMEIHWEQNRAVDVPVQPLTSMSEQAVSDP